MYKLTHHAMVHGLGVFCLISVLSSGCTTINKKVRKTTLSPEIQATPIGAKVRESLTVILGPQIVDDAAAPDVCKIQNFRASVEQALIETMAQQFAAVSTSPRGEQGHGLELIVREARIPDSYQALHPGSGPAIMNFHVVLRHHGKSIDEYQASTPPPPPPTKAPGGIMDFNWRCSLLTDYYNHNIESFAKQVQQRLFENDKLRAFWKTLE